MEIIPAILGKHFSDIEKKAALVRGLVDTVQVDVCDGRFADNPLWPYGEKGETGFGEKGEKGLPFWDELDYEFDLMVQEPEGVIADCVRMGARRCIVHLEAFEKTYNSLTIVGYNSQTVVAEKVSRFIHEWKDAVELGFALKPSTSLSGLSSFAHEVRRIQLMGSDRIGHSGVALDPRVYDRLRTLRAKYPTHDLSVDIGVNFDTTPRLVASGANILVAGSAIFRSADGRGLSDTQIRADVKQAIEQFKSLLY